MLHLSFWDYVPSLRECIIYSVALAYRARGALKSEDGENEQAKCSVEVEAVNLIHLQAGADENLSFRGVRYLHRHHVLA